MLSLLSKSRSTFHPFSSSPDNTPYFFLIYVRITTLIIAPAFLQASLYILFGRIVGRLG